jgi:hypothetical protein
VASVVSLLSCRSVSCRSCRVLFFSVVSFSMSFSVVSSVVAFSVAIGRSSSLRLFVVVVAAQVVMQEKLLTATIERGMPSDHEIVFERESEQSPVRLVLPAASSPPRG